MQECTVRYVGEKEKAYVTKAMKDINSNDNLILFEMEMVIGEDNLFWMKNDARACDVFEKRICFWSFFFFSFDISS